MGGILICPFCKFLICSWKSTLSSLSLFSLLKWKKGRVSFEYPIVNLTIIKYVVIINLQMNLFQQDIHVLEAINSSHSYLHFQ